MAFYSLSCSIPQLSGMISVDADSSSIPQKISFPSVHTLSLYSRVLQTGYAKEEVEKPQRRQVGQSRDLWEGQEAQSTVGGARLMSGAKPGSIWDNS